MLAEVPGARDGRLRCLDRPGLDAFEALLDTLGGSRSVLLTGAESKSAVAVGLATAAVSGGRRAVLLECDLLSPTLAASLGIAAEPGLGEYLRYEAEAAELLQPVLLAGPATVRASAPLVCIAAGGATEDGPELLATEGFRHVAAKLTSAYDVVVVDGPPLADTQGLLAASAQLEKTLACCAGGELPEALRPHVDGLVVPLAPG